MGRFLPNLIGTKHPWVKGIQVCLNIVPHPFQGEIIMICLYNHSSIAHASLLFLRWTMWPMSLFFFFFLRNNDFVAVFEFLLIICYLFQVMSSIAKMEDMCKQLKQRHMIKGMSYQQKTSDKQQGRCVIIVNHLISGSFNLTYSLILIWIVFFLLILLEKGFHLDLPTWFCKIHVPVNKGKDLNLFQV